MTLAEISTPANARSRRTRLALLNAAREIIESGGVQSLTMSLVTERAGVTRRAGYLHFGSRSALMGELFDHLAAAEGLEASLGRVWSAPNAAAALDAWAEHLAHYHPRLLAVDRAIEQASREDPDAAAHRRRVVAEKLRHTRRLARWLDRDGLLAPEWTVGAAADMLFALISSDVVSALMTDRHWSRSRLAEHLSVLFRRTFVGRAGRPGAAAGANGRR